MRCGEVKYKALPEAVSARELSRPAFFRAVAACHQELLDQLPRDDGKEGARRLPGSGRKGMRGREGDSPRERFHSAFPLGSERLAVDRLVVFAVGQAAVDFGAMVS